MAFILVSCDIIDKDQPSWRKLSKITYSEILTKNHEYYYILFYSPDCEFCDKILPVAIEYSKKETSYPIYVLNVDDKMNNDGIMAEEGYQYFSYIGTENYQDVVLENVPAFIVVDHNKVELLISSQTTDQPTSEIIYWLEND
jgi:thiol-disulfide isomerase/thioredoxin